MPAPFLLDLSHETFLLIGEMNARLPFVLSFVIIASLFLSGCKDKDEAKHILPSVDAAFPNSYILKIDPRLLWIQTHVSGISPITAEQMYVEACKKATIPIIGKIKINWGFIKSNGHMSLFAQRCETGPQIRC